jgi:hypothetical protein
MAPGRLRIISLVAVLVTQQFDTASMMAADTQNGGGSMAKKQSLTPGGFRPESEVHQVAPGHVLDASGGRLRELDADGNVVADFGPTPVTAPNTGPGPVSGKPKPKQNP